MAYNVSPADIEAGWRPLSVEESDVAFTLLDRAAAVLNALRPTLQARVTAGLVSETVVVNALVEVVQRVLRNPDVLRGQNIGGDGSIGVTFGTNEDTYRATPRIQFTDVDLAPIDSALQAADGVGALGGRVRSVRLINGGDYGWSFPAGVPIP